MPYEGDGRLPVIYVRGFAGGAGGIDTAVQDPLCGFNEGSVQVRVDGSDRPAYHQFESPLLRLMTDHRYQLLVHGDQEAYLRQQPAGTVPAATVWVHRFYDEFAPALTRDPNPFSLERAAQSLLELVLLVRRATGAPRVFLVAHSMGGLVARSLLQRVLPDRDEEGRLDAATDLVDRVFTYATPHGGIEFEGYGLLERVRDLTGVLGADIFGPDRMFEYLTPTRAAGAPARPGFSPATMPAGGFPVDRLFCLVGTSSDDYTAALGMAARVVGPRSDGLVRVENAYVRGAPRALVHRSHSGRFGIVNSEEGYQNLRRFLFGDLAVEARLVRLQLPGDVDDETSWQLETALSIRGLPVVLHQQSAAHLCPIQVERPAERDATGTPVPLVTTFLSSAATRPTDADGAAVPTMRHVLRLRLVSLRSRDHVLSFLDHLEQTADWADTLVVDIGPDADGRCVTWARWSSQIPGAVRDWSSADEDPLEDLDPRPGRWRVEVPVPPGSRALLGPDAAVEITVTPRATLDVAATAHGAAAAR